MVSLLYCELLKLKRSKIFFISILGSMVAPIMVFVGLIKGKVENPGMIITYADMLDQTNLYVLMLFGVIVYGVIAAYIFSREYTENTLKCILPIPISRTSFIIGKFLILFLWMILLTIIAWTCTLVLSFLGRSSAFHIALIIESLKQYCIGASLLFLTLSPVVFITLWLKNLVTPIIMMATVALGNVALFNEDLAVLFPWSSPYLIVSGRIVRYKYSVDCALLSIAITFFIGFFLSILYFKKQDIK